MKYKCQPFAPIEYMNVLIYTATPLKNLKNMRDFDDKYIEESTLGEKTMIDLFYKWNRQPVHDSAGGYRNSWPA